MNTKFFEDWIELVKFTEQLEIDNIKWEFEPFSCDLIEKNGWIVCWLD